MPTAAAVRVGWKRSRDGGEGRKGLGSVSEVPRKCLGSVASHTSCRWRKTSSKRTTPGWEMGGRWVGESSWLTDDAWWESQSASLPHALARTTGHTHSRNTHGAREAVCAISGEGWQSHALQSQQWGGPTLSV